MGTPDALARLQTIHDSICRPVRTLEDDINHAIAENSNSIAVDLGTGIIVLVKRPAEILFGYEPGELLGRSVHELVPERFREAHKMWVEQYRMSPTSRTMGSRGMSLRGLHKDGYEFPVEISLAAVHIDGLHIGIATVIHMVDRLEMSGPVAILATMPMSEKE